MKRLSILLIAALALFTNGCEMHPASELEQHHEFGDEHGEHAAHAEPAGHAPGAAAEGKHEEKKPEDGKPGEAPKFFPETK